MHYVCHTLQESNSGTGHSVIAKMQCPAPTSEEEQFTVAYGS